MDPNIVILAGGISSRMRKSVASMADVDSALRREAEEKPKSMIGIGGTKKPFLDYLLENIASAGYRDVVIVVSDRDETIREYYGRGGDGSLSKDLVLSFAVQRIPEGREKPLGTADALLQGLIAMPSWKGHRFSVCNSDNLYSVAALGLLLKDTHANATIDYDRTALRFEHDRVGQFSVIRKDRDGFLVDILEKPSSEEVSRAADAHGRVGVSMNIFRFSYDQILPFLETVPLHPLRQEKELPTAVNMMVKQHPRSLYLLPVSEHVPDLTTLTDIASVRSFIDDSLSGRPR